MVSFTGKKKFVKLSPEDGDVTTAAGGLVLNAQQTSVAFYSFLSFLETCTQATGATSMDAAQFILEYGLCPLKQSCP